MEATNESSSPVVLTRHMRLGTVADADYTAAYLVEANAAELAQKAAWEQKLGPCDLRSDAAHDLFSCPADAMAVRNSHGPSLVQATFET